MKTSFGSAALVGLALSSAMAFYAVSLHVAAERAGTEKVRLATAADLRAIRLLQAELRTRARLPELQRWNEQVMAMVPPKPGQFLGSPLMLADYRRPDAEAPAVRFVAAVAVTRATPVQQIAYSTEHVAPLQAAPVPAPTPAPASARVHVADTPPVALPSIALDATLGSTIDLAAAAEHVGNVKIALR